MTLGRIAVTGGQGFLGRQVVRACRESGYDVKTCSRATGTDLRDGAAFGRWLSAISPQCVIHCAAHVGGIGYVGQHAIDIFNDNLRISLGLMEGLRAARVHRLLTIMPNCTYPGHAPIYRESEWWDGPIHESVLMYGLPRKTLWGLCKTYGDALGLETAHLILPNLYGPGDHFDPYRSHALGALIRKIVEASKTGQSTVELWGTGTPIREWMYVDDAANAIAGFLNRWSAESTATPDTQAQRTARNKIQGQGHPIYNVGIGKGVSIETLANMIRDAANWDGAFVYDTTRPDGAMTKLLEGSRFHALTGWSPQVPLQEGIERTVAWYQANVESELHHACAGV